jgi:tripartite-type tricarboxylate transporter receptor subunit TctC
LKNRFSTRRELLQAAGALSAASLPFSQTAWAQGATGKILVGFAAGGSLDLLARQTAEALSAGSGKTYIVENKVGASGRLAVDAVKAAKPDGDTLLVCPQGPLTLFPYVFKELKFDPFRDIAPICRLTTFDVAITVGTASGTDTLPKFLAWAKSNPTKANFGSSGAGTLLHFTGVSVAQRSGTALTHVGYKGSAPAVADLIAGSVPMVVTPLSDVLEYHKAGRVKVIAVSSPRRSPLAPDVPTLKESGVDLEVPGWFALYGPTGMPNDLVRKYHHLAANALAQNSAKERLTRMGLVSAVLSPEDTLIEQKREHQLWGPMVKASGFTPAD